MRMVLMAVALVTASAACGKDSEVAAGRDSTLAPAESTYALNDRPAASGGGTATPSPAPAPAAPAATRTSTLASGTVINGTLNSTISSRTSKVGDKVTTTVSSDVKNAGGVVVVPAGSTIELTVTDIAPSRDKSSPGRLTLAVTGITVRGDQYPIGADVSAVKSDLKGRGVGTSEAGKVAVGTAVGAVAGRVIGGDKTGTIIGAVVGAAAGAAVATETANRDVVVAAGSEVGITLREPLRVPAR